MMSWLSLLVVVAVRVPGLGHLRDQDERAGWAPGEHCSWVLPRCGGLFPGGGTKGTLLGWAEGGWHPRALPPARAGPGQKGPRAPPAGLGALGGRRWQLGDLD